MALPYLSFGGSTSFWSTIPAWFSGAGGGGGMREENSKMGKKPGSPRRWKALGKGFQAWRRVGIA